MCDQYLAIRAQPVSQSKLTPHGPIVLKYICTITKSNYRYLFPVGFMNRLTYSFMYLRMEESLIALGLLTTGILPNFRGPCFVAVQFSLYTVFSVDLNSSLFVINILLGKLDVRSSFIS